MVHVLFISGRIRQRRALADGGAIGGTLALALLVCGCVLLALTGPALSLKLRTQAMREQLASQGGTFHDDLVATAYWPQFATDFDTVPLDVGPFAQSAALVARGLRRAVPVAAGTWAALTTAPYSAPRHFAALTDRTQLELTYRTSLTAYTRLVAGTLGGTVPAKMIGVSVTTATASRFGLRPGSVVKVSTGGGYPALRLYVTGVVSVRGPAAPFWVADPLAAAPVQVIPPPGGPPPYWTGALIVDPGQLLALQDLACPGNGRLPCPTMDLRWEVPMNLSSFTADQAQALANDLLTADSGATLSSTLGAAAADVTVNSAAALPLNTFIANQGAVLTVLDLLLISLVATGLAVIAIAARLIVGQRQDELRMLRARGATVSQLARRVLAGSALAVLPATVAATLLALIPVRLNHADLSTGWRLAAVVVLVALAAPPLLAAWRHRKAQPSAVNQAVILTAETRAARFSPAARRRLLAGGTLCAVAAAVLLLLHQEGLPAPGSVNWTLTVAPVLVAIPAALAAMRLYPLLVRLLLRGWRRVSATGYLALASSTRLPATLAAYALVLALTLAAFCGMVSGGVSAGQIAASWQSADGADATVALAGPSRPDSGQSSTSPLTPSAQRQLAAVPGVRHLAAVTTTSWRLGDGTQFTLLQVDPAQYAALAAGTPFGPVPAAPLTSTSTSPGSTGTSYPVLASPQLAAELSHHATAIDGLGGITGQLRIRLAGSVPQAPGQPSAGQFALLAQQKLPVSGLAPGPNLLLVTGTFSASAFSAVLHRALPGATVTYRSTLLDSLTSAPLMHAAAVLMTLSVAACSGLAVLGFLLGLALGARDREQVLARLAVLGHQRSTSFALISVLPALLAAAAAAVACALALPALVGSALNLSVFTGSDAPVSFRPDLMALALPGAAIVVLACVLLAVRTRRTRRNISSQLRVG